MDRWHQIELLFQEALQRDPAERDAYVREACHGDAGLHREVASLLANHREASQFNPWAASAAAQLIAGRASLKAGQRLGPYEILAPIGNGGMGEVYRATDTRLRREVAIKICAERFTERFEREARAIASLNHPHICQLYDVGPNYLVMELVEGPTLAERIARGALSVEEALAIARQIADALEAAYEKGIVHRDLKPANIKVKSDGTVKVLDFGLAKAAEEPCGASHDTSTSPTQITSATRVGMILGTAAYMSPEQARGAAVDKRTDIWAFGCVLYELLTGKRAFAGKTTSDALAAVIRDEPDWEAVPLKLQRLVRACLKKDPKARLHDIADARLLLEDTSEAVPASRSKWPWIVAAVLALLSAALAILYFRQTPPEVRVITTSINPPENTNFDFTLGYRPALSPDGRRIVFSARGGHGKNQLWMRPLDSPAAQPLAGTERATFPFWSPDSRSIGFFQNGKLKRMDVNGGSVLTLADAPTATGGSWSPQNVIVFGPAAGGLQRIPASGGVPAPATTVVPGRDSGRRFPEFLPDGRHFLFIDVIQAVRSDTGSNIILRAGALDSTEVKTIGPASSNVLFSSGYLLYVREGTLMAQPFNEKRLLTAGEAAPVAEQISTPFWGLGAGAAAGIFSVSREGLLAYQSGEAEDQQLTWFDRSGIRLGNVGEADNIWSLEFSPDRRRVAVTVIGRNHEIWIYNVAGGLRTRFTFGPSDHRDAVWSPDGRSIVYISEAGGHSDLYRKAADGTGDEELLYADGHNNIPTSWSPDGKFLLYQVPELRGIYALPLVPVSGARRAPLKLFPRSSTPSFLVGTGKFSPDGHWVAYTSNESGRAEIYVSSFAGPSARRQISTGGGTQPRWRADGKEIFYIGPNGTVMAAEVSIKGTVIEPGAVHSMNIPGAQVFYRYDVSLDGKRFLVATPREQKSPPITLVQNWTALVKNK